MLKLLLICILCIGCGKIKVHIPSTEQTVYIGPDFKEAIQICEDRYLPNDEEVEACFRDYRSFLSLDVSLTMKGILKYCKDSFEDIEDQQRCESDITTILEE